MAAIIYNNIPFEDVFMDGEAHNLAFGRFFTAWSQVESAYTFAAKTLTSGDPAVIDLLVDKARTTDILEIVNALAERIEDETLRARFAAAMTDAKTLSTKRNKVAHGGWGYFNNELARYSHELTGDDFNEIMRETQVGNNKRRTRIFTANDIDALATECVRVRDELVGLLPTLPDKRGEQQQREYDLKAQIRDLHLGRHPTR